MSLKKNLLLMVLVGFLQPGGLPAAERRPNILWLVGENLSHDLGCYGAGQVHTPNLDRLAAEGVRYTRVFSTNRRVPPVAPHFSPGCTRLRRTLIQCGHTAMMRFASQPGCDRSPTG